MKYINRTYKINKLVKPGQVLVIYGPRRAGKTTLVQEYINDISTPALYKAVPATYSGGLVSLSDSGDNITTQNILSSMDTEKILNHVAGLNIYVVDEAQNIPNIGQALKIIVDNRPDLIVIATGSSSFDLANKIGEPLVGRREVITLYPFAMEELGKNYPRHMLDNKLYSILTYGLYPQVYNAETNFEKESKLQELIDGYLLKDIFALEQIQAPAKLLHLIKLLAQYIGQPISSSKLASDVGLNQKTVDRYLDLFEKTFIIKKIMPFANKMSQSLKFKPKYYFYDLGIRNALLGDFSNITERVDIGNIWENFCFIERIKKNEYARQSHPKYYFYRSYQNKNEIDIIEEYNGYKAFECKWTSDKSHTTLLDWDTQYPNSKISIINKDNFIKYLV